MNWIKTSKKLPNKTGEYFVKRNLQYCTHRETPKDVLEYCGSEDDTFWQTVVEEWLDESVNELEILRKQNEHFKKQILSMNETITELQIIDKTDTQRLD